MWAAFHVLLLETTSSFLEVLEQEVVWTPITSGRMRGRGVIDCNDGGFWSYDYFLKCFLIKNVLL
jgi:hypothetical protein